MTQGHSFERAAGLEGRFDRITLRQRRMSANTPQPRYSRV